MDTMDTLAIGVLGVGLSNNKNNSIFYCTSTTLFYFYALLPVILDL